MRRRPFPEALLTAALLHGCGLARTIHPRAAEEVTRGYAWLAAGDAERAEVAFAHALAFDGAFPEAENGLGVLARTRGDLAEARRRFERAMALRGDFAEAHANLGELLLSSGEGAAAEARLRVALAIDPDLADARQNLARALLWRGLSADERERAACLAEARRQLLHLLEADPGRAAAHADLGYLAWLAGDAAGAEAAYRRALALEPASPAARRGLCAALLRLGRTGEVADGCGG